MSNISTFIGDAPTWIASLVVIFAAAQYKSEGRSRRAEADREAKHQASQLVAWAATYWTASGDQKYGVVVSNTSGSTFHSVKIKASLHRAEVPQPIELVVLPPGDYWVQFKGPRDQYGWDFPRDVRELDEVLRPYMKTEGYLVNEASFADNRNQRWSINEHAVLTGLSDPHVERPAIWSPSDATTRATRWANRVHGALRAGREAYVQHSAPGRRGEPEPATPS